jgi:hypothetical protein
MKTCYCCDKISVSLEHVPPKCIFPEVKDMQDGNDYRKNLIKVPSCDLHNQAKSTDDQYLLLILLMGFFNNQIAGKQFATKMLRSLQRKPVLYHQLFSTSKPVTIDTLPSVSVGVDRARFNDSIEKICRGLYFHDKAEKWEMPIQVHTPLLLTESSPEYDRMISELSQKAIQKLSHHPKKGDNHEIFWYQYDSNKTNILTFRLVFYGGFEVFAFSNKAIK